MRHERIEGHPLGDDPSTAGARGWRKAFLMLAFLVPLAATGEPAVVIDPGHGGTDYGAKGHSGRYEKAVVLKVARALGDALKSRDIESAFTRKEDRFVSLSERTELANRSGATLYLSIHANSAPDPQARGSETYFLSLDASDDEARRVAMTENQVFKQEGTASDGGDVVGAILGDLIRTDHLRGSSRIAAAIQRKLGKLPGPSRGVKQAPFVVLMGVNMPAALVEVGFLTHPGEEQKLESVAYRKRVANQIADAVVEFLENQPRESTVPHARAKEID